MNQSGLANLIKMDIYMNFPIIILQIENKFNSGSYCTTILATVWI